MYVTREDLKKATKRTFSLNLTSFVDRFCKLCFMLVCVVIFSVLCSLVVTCWERADPLAVVCVVLSLSKICPGPYQNQG